MNQILLPFFQRSHFVVLILRYCTGGIRCDVYSTFLRSKGFTNLYTLEGGIQVGERWMKTFIMKKSIF